MEQVKSYKQMSREERGLDIIKRFKIVKTPFGWRVPSTSGSGQAYMVKFNGHQPRCNCPDCELRKRKCKHIFAVEFYIKQEIDREGKITQTKGVKISYSQDWKAYDNAQTNEKLVFLKILKELCNYVEQPEYEFGRPKIPYADLVFGSILRVYSTFSLRRFMSDLKIAKEMQLVDTLPCYASIGHFLQKEELTDILKNLIKISSTPLSAVETVIAGDSSGFSTSRFGRWFDYKFGKERRFRVWLKAHITVGVKTNIIASAEVTEGTSSDCPQLPRLVREASQTFRVSEVVCDKAYLSKENLKVIDEIGAIPFIPFKSNSNPSSHAGGSSSIWKKMYHYFLYKHEEYLEHYHKRSNVETAFHMLKSKFGSSLRSKNKTAQINEVLLKIICHNICVVVQEMNELGIKGEFTLEEKR